MNVNSMTGIEVLKAMLNGDLPHPPIAETIPMKALQIDKGFIRFTAKADARHLNPMGGVHGGFAATVLDSVTGCAVHSALDAGIRYGTIDLNIKIVRPVPVNTELFAEGHLINLSKSIGISEGQIKDVDGKLYAHGTCICSIIRPANSQ